MLAPLLLLIAAADCCCCCCCCPGANAPLPRRLDGMLHVIKLIMFGSALTVMIRNQAATQLGAQTSGMQQSS